MHWDEITGELTKVGKNQEAWTRETAPAEEEQPEGWTESQERVVSQATRKFKKEKEWVLLSGQAVCRLNTQGSGFVAQVRQHHGGKAHGWAGSRLNDLLCSGRV